MKIARNILLYTSWFTFVWAVACWFSGSHETAFLGLAIFRLDSFWLLILSIISLIAGLTIKQLSAREEQALLPDNKKVPHKELVFLSMIILAHILLQLPMLLMESGANDFDSSMKGIQSHHIAQGKERPVFIYNWQFNGTLNSHICALLHNTFGPDSRYMRLINTAFYVGFLLLFYMLLRLYFGNNVSLVAVLIAAFPPAAVFRLLKYSEFPELAFWGTLALVLVTKINERSSANQFFIAGAVMGIAFYTHPQAIVIILSSMILLLSKDVRIFSRLRFWGVVPGFLTGSIPIFIDFWYNSANFLGKLLNAKGHQGILANSFNGLVECVRVINAYLGGMYEVLEGYSSSEIIPAEVSFVILVALVGWFVYSFRNRIGNIILKGYNNPNPLIFPIVLILALLVFAMTALSNPPAPYRYIFFVWLVIPVLISHAIFSLAGKNRMAIILCLTIVLAFFLGTTLFIELPHAVASDSAFAEIIDLLEKEHVTAVYAGFGFAYNIGFISHDSIAVTTLYHHGEEILPHTTERVEQDPSPAFFFSVFEKTELNMFLKNLQRLGAKFQISQIPSGILIHKISPRITHRNLEPIKDSGKLLNDSSIGH